MKVTMTGIVFLTSITIFFEICFIAFGYLLIKEIKHAKKYHEINICGIVIDTFAFIFPILGTILFISFYL